MRHRDFGLLVCDQHRATPGLTLFSPLNGKATYIIGLRGDVLHQWAHPLVNGTYAYLLENGNLLWTGRLPEGPQHMGGRGGLIREYDWNGKVLWEHRHVGQHHDFRRLPNGNTLFLGWEVVPPEIADRIPGAGVVAEERGSQDCPSLDGAIITSRARDRNGRTVALGTNFCPNFCPPDLI